MESLAEIDRDTWRKVRQAFADALGLDEEDVEFDHRVIEDLEAESLDFLDIAFRLERAFGIKIPRGGLEQAAREGGDGVDANGVLTDEGRRRLIEAMPEIPRDEIRPGLRATEIAGLFRVATFYYLVIKLLDEKQASA